MSEVNPKTGRKNVKGSPRPSSHFAKLSQTPEGRAQLAEWRSRRGKGKLGRPHGALDGYTRIEREAIIAQAQAEAKRLVKLMEEKGLNIPKEQYAREAFEEVVALVRRQDINPKDKLAACNTVLTYTLAKPASESTVTVKKAEDFLADLASEMKENE